MIKMTNKEMDDLLNGLEELMDKARGKLGYAIAKNYRILSEELNEYTEIKNTAIIKFGEKDNEGHISIQLGTEAHKQYLNEMKQYDDIKSDVNILIVSPEDVYSSNLTAKEVSRILCMIKEDNNETE